MKKRIVAPTVGIVLALLAAGCGGGGSSPTAEAPPPSGTPAPPPPAPGPSPAPATVANSVAQVKSDMTGTHESMPAGFTSTGPEAKQKIAPAGAIALGGFGQVFVAADNAAANTRVQLRNLETYVLSKSTPTSSSTWKRVQYSERVTGAFYTVNYTGAGAASNVRVEGTGGISVKPIAGQVFRFWPESGLTQNIVPVVDVEAVFTTVQAKLIVDSSGATDDRASARLLVSTAADWRSSMTLYATPVPAAGNFVAGTTTNVGKLRLAQADWRAMNFHSATTPGPIDALATPLAGGTAPLANSMPFEVPRAKRVIVVGDSISEGDAVQDSFRRPLWNAIVSDATNPLVDFVGTRRGITSNGGTCDNGASVSNGTPADPEFDQDHEAYWGWCVDDVNAVLPAKLATLAAPATDRRPDIALVHLGTNDLDHQLQSGAQVGNELAALVSTLRAANPSIRILLAQLIPMSSGTPAKDAEIGVLNAQIAELAASLDTSASPITVVDQNTGFSNVTGVDRYDGFHPNDSGEQKMAAKWFPALKAALQ